ncbi:unnamed protein product [Miscanthus lutarioriparius]|uniref:FAS1 domain-containing protein n=1 Tax=Miscanthus lutarioriparius TaxID=422564 RepID=A0A811PS33_9POAL|nr:unnamed protein product [Miscanthus lutarioriparius]
MAFFKQVIFTTAVLAIVLSSPAIAHKAKSPAPPVHHVDLSNLLTAYSTFHTFLGYLQKTNVIQTFQKQANNTELGITMFVPKDSAFAALKNTTLAMLTKDQLRSLLLYHALPKFYDLHGLAMLGRRNPVATFAGSRYTLKLTEHYGNILVRSACSTAKIGSSIVATAPVGVYLVNKVLLPKQIFKSQPGQVKNSYPLLFS